MLGKPRIPERARMARKLRVMRDRSWGGFDCRPLLDVNYVHGQQFSKIVRELVGQFKASEEHPLRILDAGCGKSTFLRELKAEFGGKIHAVGLDVNLSKEQRTEQGIEWRVGHVNNLSRMFGKDEPFHLVVSTYGVEYSKDIPGAIREALLVTRKNGRIFLNAFGRPPEEHGVFKNQAVKFRKKHAAFMIIKKSDEVPELV